MQGHGEKRSRTEEQLIAALLTHPSIEAAAESVGISPVTAWRWMKDQAFAARCREARREVMRHTMGRLQEASQEAVDCLRKLQRAGKSESVRIAAARTILDHAMQAVELEDVQQRLDALEQRQRSRT